MTPKDQAIAHALAGLRPVRRLPGVWVLVMETLLLLGVIAACGVWWLGSSGVLGLDLAQRTALGLILASLLALLAYGCVQSMIPGALFRVRVLGWAGVFGLAFVVVIAATFHSRYRFDLMPVHRACFLRGLTVTAAALGAVLIQQRRGFRADRAAAIRLAFGAAVVTALIVLTIYCPIQSWSHVLIAHVGAVVVALLAGFGIAHFSR